eukprot:jgi/Botrbrau1/20002/Bobra.200_1s0010.1
MDTGTGIPYAHGVARSLDVCHQASPLTLPSTPEHWDREAFGPSSAPTDKLNCDITHTTASGHSQNDSTRSCTPSYRPTRGFASWSSRRPRGLGGPQSQLDESEKGQARTGEDGSAIGGLTEEGKFTRRELFSEPREEITADSPQMSQTDPCKAGRQETQPEELNSSAEQFIGAFRGETQQDTSTQRNRPGRYGWEAERLNILQQDINEWEEAADVAAHEASRVIEWAKTNQQGKPSGSILSALEQDEDFEEWRAQLVAVVHNLSFRLHRNHAALHFLTAVLRSLGCSLPLHEPACLQGTKIGASMEQPAGGKSHANGPPVVQKSDAHRAEQQQEDHTDPYTVPWAPSSKSLNCCGHETSTTSGGKRGVAPAEPRPAKPGLHSANCEVRRSVCESWDSKNGKDREHAWSVMGTHPDDQCLQFNPPHHAGVPPGDVAGEGDEELWQRASLAADAAQGNAGDWASDGHSSDYYYYYCMPKDSPAPQGNGNRGPSGAAAGYADGEEGNQGKGAGIHVLPPEDAAARVAGESSRRSGHSVMRASQEGRYLQVAEALLERVTELEATVADLSSKHLSLQQSCAASFLGLSEWMESVGIQQAFLQQENQKCAEHTETLVGLVKHMHSGKEPGNTEP